MRDVNYMCEAVTRDSNSWWTINGGYCLPYPLAYQTLRLDSIASKNQCIFSLKCALSNSLDQNCNCKNTAECRKVVYDFCVNSYQDYPGTGALLSPYVYMQYARERDWTNKKPDMFVIKGRLKCIGYQLVTNVSWWLPIFEGLAFYDYLLWQHLLCNRKEGMGVIRNTSGPRYDISCWNNSKTFNNRSYQVSFICETRCISKYRVRDGISDCIFMDEAYTINNSCPQIQRHRLQCSSSELTCLLAGALGNVGSDCSNKRDEFDDESGTVFNKNIKCTQRADPGCIYFRNYIRMSSYNNTNKITIFNNSILDDHSITTTIPFRSYCNSFFNTISGIDESPEFCEKWVCFRDQYQCLSGQCIALSWVCDGEWDCNDGSDEQRVFIMDRLNEHNSKLMNLIEIKQICAKQYRLNNTPFSDICDISSEYPCFRTDVDDPFNVKLNRPCINLTQIGDGKIDCITGLDERNRLHCSNMGMLGFHFPLDDHRCMEYPKLCTTTYSSELGGNVAYDTVCFHRKQLFKNGTQSNCNSASDVMCLNDSCLKNARCNGANECLHGEDEYRCLLQDQSHLHYRETKNQFEYIGIRLDDYPSPAELLESNHRSYRNDNDPSLSFIVDKTNSQLNFKTDQKSINNTKSVDSEVKSIYEIVRDSLSEGTITFEEHYLPFICNRGIAIRYFTNKTVCFCPPSFYGSQCEFYSDRITVATHLDLTNYRPSFQQTEVIKVLTTFLFQEQIIDYYEFHVNPRTQTNDNYVKQGIYFLYPRLQPFLQMKKINRSGTQLYKVRFEAFNLYLNEAIPQPIGVWEYPIYFDFFPVFRLSKILRFDSSISSLSDGPCLNNPCRNNGMCQEVLNSNRSSYFCFCNSAYYGIHCEYYDKECNDYCSPKSICKPKYNGIITGNQQPLCLCSASTFGKTCYIKNNKCQNNPCLNGGSCLVNYDLSDIDKYTCLCTDSFSGDYCQVPKEMVDIRFVISSDFMLQADDVVATTISYNDINDFISLSLNVRHHQVYRGLPSHLKLIYSHKLRQYAPPTAVSKIYRSNFHSEEPEYYILYFYHRQTKINITVDLTSENHCPLVETLWHLVQQKGTLSDSPNSTFNSSISVFSYHRICQAKRNTNTTYTCFRDLNYLCICEGDHYRTECFEYDRSIDQCSLCLSNGYCLKGELNNKTDFLCLCPHCHYGKICEFSNELMSFTLDSLIVKDVQISTKLSTIVYVSITLLIFLFGLFNNLCSFLTFVRPKPRKVGVGNYLLIISLIDQCSLLFLLLKIIHIIFGTNGTLFYYERFNLYSCKIISYLLSVFTRIIYWLSSLVTIERLFVVLFPTSVTLKKPRFALFVSLLIILVVCGMHIHEAMYYKTIIDPSYPSINVTLCVTSYVQQLVSLYNRTNVLIHYFIPFLIQVVSITILIFQIARSRERTTGSNQQTFIDLFKKQFKIHREYYITPIIIILSSLPQAILSFSYACTELKQPWQRYSLLTTYFLAYLPQILGFVLYVLPSTTYTEEFHQTIMGKRIGRQQRVTAATKQQTMQTETKPTKSTMRIVTSSKTEINK